MGWLRRLFLRGRLEADLDKELRFHFESQVDGKVRSGIPESEARRLTRIEFGGIEQIKEDCRAGAKLSSVCRLRPRVREARRVRPHPQSRLRGELFRNGGPEWSRADESHLLGSSSVVTNIHYGKGTITYCTFDAGAQMYFASTLSRSSQWSMANGSPGKRTWINLATHSTIRRGCCAFAIRMRVISMSRGRAE